MKNRYDFHDTINDIVFIMPFMVIVEFEECK